MAEIVADVLPPNAVPALSATSDMPVIAETPAADPPPPAEEAADAPQDATEGEATATEEAPAEGAEGEVGTEGEGEAPATETKPRRPGVQQRFSELTNEKKIEIAKREAAEAHAARLEELLAKALAKEPPATETKPEPTVVEPPPADPRPVRETFDNPDAYDEALIQWSTKRAFQVAQAEQARHDAATKEAADRAAAEQNQQQTFAAIQEKFAERRTVALEKYSDYAEVAESENINISYPVAMALLQSENGPDAAYYLGQHPEIADKIASIVVPGAVFPEGTPMAGKPVPDVQRQLIELGKVFAAISQPETPIPKPPPPPPAPINPLRRGNNGAVNRSLEEIGNEQSMEDYVRARASSDDPIGRATAARLSHGRIN